MAHFSNSQKAKCVLWLAEFKNIQTVQKKFQQEYYVANPDVKEITIKFPSEEEIRRWYEKFEETGSINGVPKDKERSRLLSSRTNSLDLHTTTYEKETGLLNFFGFKKIHKCHPYKMRLNSELDELDIAMRKNFAKVIFKIKGSTGCPSRF